MTPDAIIRSGGVIPCQPWPRHLLPPAGWAAMASALAHDPLELIALWADTVQVHALFAGPLLVSVAVVDGVYPALSPWRPAAAGFERMVRDLWGHVAEGGRDARPLLDHGRWEIGQPMALRVTASDGAAEPVFRPGPEGLHQIALGPVLPGITEPAHWRLHARGEAVTQAEVRLGYAHRGILALMRGKPARAAARFVARLAADATVAHSLAFARAAEAALGVEAPPRAQALRAVMAETERAAVHLDALAGLCGACGAGVAQMAFGRLREGLLWAAEQAFGHRLMMDVVVPGGVALDIAGDGAAAILAASAALAEAPALLGPGLAARLDGLGHPPVTAWAPGGVAGRAAGRPGDARMTPGYAPYGTLTFGVPVLAAGDVAARTAVRLAEIAHAAALLGQLLAALPPGACTVALPAGSGEGLGVAESVRGDVWHWLRLDGGMIGAAFAADAGWRLWPVIEAALAGSGVADAEIILRSFEGSVSGVDL